MDEKMQAFVAAAHEVAKQRLVLANSGNLSWRVGDGLVFITGTRTWMERLTEDDVAVFRLADGEQVGGAKPSVEALFHLGILRERSDVDVVLHFQTSDATAVASIAPGPPNYFVIPEVAYYIGPIASVPFLLPGSEELAEAVVSAAKRHNLVQLRNHGQVTVGKTFDDVIVKGIFFEMACAVILRAGQRLTHLPEEAAEALRQWGRESRSEGGA
jgi:ribulose-5-phosphate 4-epimerase/fuculose-1-phosphate aldolase